MKKITLLLSLLLIFAFAGFSQSVIPYANFQEKSEAQELTPKEKAMVEKFLAEKQRKMSEQKASHKAAGGVVDGIADYSDILFNALSGVFRGSFTGPVFPDSSVVIGFTNSFSNATDHAFGMIYDPTSDLFGDPSNGGTQFDDGDVVNVDSIFVDGLYFFNDPTDTQDSLAITVVIGDPSNTNNPFSFFVLPPSFTGLNDTGTYPVFDYVGDPNFGVHNGLGGPITARYTIPLGQNDTIGGINTFSVPTNLTIPAGNIMGVWVEFLPTPGGWSPGDTTDLPTDQGDFNAFRPFGIINDDANDDAFWSMLATDNSLQHNSVILTPFARHNSTSTNNADAPGNLITVSRFINSVYVHVSGTSTVSIDEASYISLNIYPNPSSGLVNVEIPKGGTYDLEVMNMLGQIVYSDNLTVNANERVELNLSNLAKGIYLLNINGEGVTKSNKLTLH